MKRRYRLAAAERYRQVRQSGASYTHGLMVLCLLPNEQNISRCGFTVSRRVGNAVQRNLARRRMREAVRGLWNMVDAGWDLVWIARPAINDAEFADLQIACARLLRRAHLMKPESPPYEGTLEARLPRPAEEPGRVDGAEAASDSSAPRVAKAP